MTQAPSDPNQRQPPLFIVAIIGSVLTAFLFITAGVGSQLINIGFGLWFSEVFVFFAVPYLALRLSSYDAFKAAGVCRPWLGGAAFGAMIGAVNFFALVVPLQVVSQHLAPKVLVEMFDVSGIFKHQTPVELFAVVTGVCIAAPFCEEFFFRGLIQRGAEKQVGTTRAVLMTAVVFSAFHLDPIGFPARFELGVLFGWLMARSGSIWPGVFAHLANNSVSVALYFFASEGTDPEQELDNWVPVAMFALGGLLLYAIWRIVSPSESTVLLAPWRAHENSKPARAPSLVVGWILAALISVAALVTVDGQGVRLNVFDAINPLREPKKADGEEARRAWDALYALRKDVRRGSAKLSEYEVARRVAIADRQTVQRKR